MRHTHIQMIFNLFSFFTYFLLPSIVLEVSTTFIHTCYMFHELGHHNTTFDGIKSFQIIESLLFFFRFSVHASDRFVFLAL